MYMEFSNRLNALALVAALAFAITESAQANLAVNGGFETGDFTGWTQAGNTDFSGVDTAATHSGLVGAFFGAIGSTGGILQDVPTTAGVSYDFDFWLRNPSSDTPSEAHVFWNGTEILTLTNPNSFGYTHHQFVVTATAASTPIQFSFRNDLSFFELDDVNVSEVRSVPDGGTTSTLLGMAMLGLAVARRKLR